VQSELDVSLISTYDHFCLISPLNCEIINAALELIKNEGSFLSCNLTVNWEKPYYWTFWQYLSTYYTLMMFDSVILLRISSTEIFKYGLQIFIIALFIRAKVKKDMHYYHRIPSRYLNF